MVNSRLTNGLEEIAEKLRQTFLARDIAREKALPLCREALRYASHAIRAVHRQEFDQAQEGLESAHNLLVEVVKVIDEHKDLYGLVRDAQKEFAEGSTLLAMVTGNQLPGPAELGIDAAAYINGLGEAVGELRRYLLDSMRRNDLSFGEELLSAMDDIYNVLVTMDFPDAITGGLRRTTDTVRGVLERTRSDLTLTVRQKELEATLEKFQPRAKRAVKRRKTVPKEIV